MEKSFFLMLFTAAGLLSAVNSSTQSYTSSTDEKLNTPQAILHPANDDEYFLNFRLNNFAPATEPFIKERYMDCDRRTQQRRDLSP